MQITLKRADFYARAALKAATETKYPATLEFSIYSPALNSSTTDSLVTEISANRTKVIEAYQLSLDLIRAAYAIRASLADANMNSGVSTRLTENKKLEAEEGRLRALIKAIEAVSNVETTPEAILAKAEASRSRDKHGERYLSRDSTVDSAVFTEDDIVGFRKQLKRIVDTRGRLNDELTALNVGNSITLDRATIATLRKADILPA